VELSDQVKLFLITLGMTYKDLSEKSGVRAMIIQSIVEDGGDGATVKELREVAAALNCRLEMKLVLNSSKD